MAKREFLMLAHEYRENEISIGSLYMSEKLDGQRAWWDGGITRGIPASDVPFANVEKDARFRNQQIATGLWSRYGKVIHAPDWWLDKLPTISLDGELYIERGRFQELCSTVRQLIPGPGWERIKFMVFESPPLDCVLSYGKINNANFKKEILWAMPQMQELVKKYHPAVHRPEFEFVQNFLNTLPQNEVFQLLKQERLPTTTSVAYERMHEKLFEVTANGGEGLMLRHGFSIWMPERSHFLLKVKKMQDAEARVIGYTWGRETDKGSKLLGKMGALLCQMSNGITFELSGFTDQEREMKLIGEFEKDWRELYDAAATIGTLHPGERVQDDIGNPTFPRGSVVTYKYRELTDAGRPKEARFFRKKG